MGETSKGLRARARGKSGSDSVASGSALTRPGQLKAALESGVIDLDEFTQACVDGMSATKSVVADGVALDVADFPTRLAFLRFITETVEGMPVKRQEIVSRKIPTTDDLVGLIERSPAFAREVRAILNDVDARKAAAAAGPQSAIEAGALDVIEGENSQ